jgi:hypothetical protein
MPNWLRVGAHLLRKARRMCCTCHARRTMLLWTQDWYGPVLTCLACGDSWNEDGMAERPFMRGWRQDRVAHARKFWEQMKMAKEAAHVHD